MELKETHTNEPREVRHGSTGRQEAEVKKKKKNQEFKTGLGYRVRFYFKNEITRTV